MSAQEDVMFRDDLLLWQQHIVRMVQETVDSALAQQHQLRSAVTQILHLDDGSQSLFRLLPLALHGALTGRTESAVPVCGVSRLWWVGAEVMDDVMDGQFDAPGARLTPSAAIVAASACITLLPHEVIRRQGVASVLEQAWTHELTRSGITAADGQLDDVAEAEGMYDWARVMVSYAGKTGAAYARDAVMAAQLASISEEQVRGWRTFGKLFGVLRQTVNDRGYETAEDDADLRNGTRTLLLAHAVEVLPSEEADSLIAAHTRARNGLEARKWVWDRLRRSDVAQSYNGRIAVMWRQLTALLEAQAPPSKNRDLLQWMVTVSARAACVTVEERVSA